MNCPKPLEINRFADGELDLQRQGELAAHFQNCPGCSQALSDLMGIKEKITQGLDHSAPVFIPPFKARSLVSPKPGLVFQPLKILVMASFMMAVLGLFWLFSPADPQGVKRPQGLAKGPGRTEILDITIRGERVDTLIFNDPDNKTMFVWAQAKQPR